MHKEILTKEQNKLLPLVAEFSKNFYLVGGTAIAFHLGHRAKWKDYVDLYFVMKKYGGVVKIISKGDKIFGSEFNEKIFRVQLTYFKDINYSEEILYMDGFKVDDEIIKKELINFSLS